MIPFLVSISISIAMGYLAASFFWPHRLPRAMLWAFAWPMGAGICSLIFYLFRRPMFTVEIALLLALAAIWFSRRRPAPSHWSSSEKLPSLALLIAALVGFVVAPLLFIVHQDPHGDWDAFAIWNSHARYLYRDGPAWQTHIRNTFHADYPLLVPSMNARAWRYAGQEIPETGGWLGLLYLVSALGVLVATLADLRGLRLAMIIGSVLLATPFFLEFGVMQSADVPLSLYFLSAFALLCLYSERAHGESGLLVLSGFMAGCAGWTKNEGLLFIVAVCVSLLAPVFFSPSQTLRRFGPFLAGLVPPALVILLFKVTIVAPNENLSNRQYGEVFAKVVNPDRYLMILSSFAQTLWSFGNWAINPLIPLLVFVGLSALGGTAIRHFGWLTSASAFVVVLAGYFVVYVIAPTELQWVLAASNSRLFLQLWAPFLLLAGLLAVQYEHAP